jgi:3-oxoacyl-[acyl-carrier-protein] synthase II
VGRTDQDPDIPLRDIVTEPRAWEPGPALSNSFGFGGHNTVVAIGPPR